MAPRPNQTWTNSRQPIDTTSTSRENADLWTDTI
jgi:hypothetical protein